MTTVKLVKRVVRKPVMPAFTFKTSQDDRFLFSTEGETVTLESAITLYAKFGESGHLYEIMGRDETTGDKTLSEPLAFMEKDGTVVDPLKKEHAELWEALRLHDTAIDSKEGRMYRASIYEKIKTIQPKLKAFKN